MIIDKQSFKPRVLRWGLLVAPQRFRYRLCLNALGISADNNKHVCLAQSIERPQACYCKSYKCVPKSVPLQLWRLTHRHTHTPHTHTPHTHQTAFHNCRPENGFCSNLDRGFADDIFRCRHNSLTHICKTRERYVNLWIKLMYFDNSETCVYEAWYYRGVTPCWFRKIIQLYMGRLFLTCIWLNSIGLIQTGLDTTWGVAV